MKDIWKIKSEAPVEFLKDHSDYNPVILQLLYNRGLKNREEIEKFLNPSYHSSIDPFVLSGIFDAVLRILEALEKQEKITIYADYDADAVTACAVIYKLLKKLNAQNLEYYIPDRFSEGYGLSQDAIRQIAGNGTKLLITVDCGINAVSETELAKTLGMEVVITDHHQISGKLPDAYAVVNPKKDLNCGLENITGVGVAFKLVQAILFAINPEVYKDFNWPAATKKAPEVPNRLRDRFSNLVPAQWEKWLLDLVAIGTIADCQDLLGENRIFAKFGLKVLKKTKWPGLKILLQYAAVDSRADYDEYVVGFIIAPRINSAGRIQHAGIALRLLITDDAQEAALLAGQLESLNAHRQRITEQLLSDAREQALSQLDQSILLMKGRGWPKGVIGLVSSRIADEFQKPNIVLDITDGIATGSARSYGSFDIFQAINSAKDILEKFGGHPQAAGLTLKEQNIENLLFHLLRYSKANPHDNGSRHYIDMKIEPRELDLNLAGLLKELSPFGPGNPPIRFLLEKMLLETLSQIGKDGKHLRLQASKHGHVYKFIAFRFGNRGNHFTSGDLIDLIVEPSENFWNGRTEVQLKIVDLSKN